MDCFSNNDNKGVPGTFKNETERKKAVRQSDDYEKHLDKQRNKQR